MKTIRNIAVIAHVDHGKTTLVDHIMRQCHLFGQREEVTDCFLDSNDLERERGITILSKNISVTWKGVKINIIDTPGHADFGGEVERVLSMADGVLLLVDAFEGPMPQTRFVLSKALSRHLKPVVVINKMDKPNARHQEVENEIFDLFIDLGADDDLLEYPTLYASGRDGWVSCEPEPGTDVHPLLDVILEKVPPPKDNPGPAQFLVTNFDFSRYLGRIAIGRLFRGELKQGQQAGIIRAEGDIRVETIKNILVFEGLERKPVEIATNGDILALVGLEDVEIGDTISDTEHPDPLPRIAVDEPTVCMLFTSNDSPFFGRAGKYVTSRHLRERLFQESKRDVALRVEEGESADSYIVFGRGVLHLSILVETMRREGYEFQVGQPRVLFKTIEGALHEPFEILTVEVPEPLVGKVMELVGPLRGELVQMSTRGDSAQLEISIPERGLFGLRNRLLTSTAGNAVMYYRFEGYKPWKGEIPRRTTGVLVSNQEGKVTAYALDGLKDRGTFFVEPGEDVYCGQIVGEHCRDNDLNVNVQKGKKLTNIRAAGSDRNIILAPAWKMSLEDALEYIEKDELVEVTPKSIRLRKILLDQSERKRAEKTRTGSVL